MKKPNILLICSVILLSILYTCVSFIDYRLYKYDGVIVDLISVTFMPFFMIIAILMLALFFSHSLNEKRLNIYLLFLCVILNLTIIYKTAQIIPQTYTHYKYSIALKDTRFEIKNISLNDIDTLNKGNYIVYIGRPSCIDCAFAYNKLYKSTQIQPLRIRYYNTENDRNENNEKMTEILDTYQVKSVPTVLFFVKGELDKILKNDEIIESFDTELHYYKARGIFFIK